MNHFLKSIGLTIILTFTVLLSVSAQDKADALKTSSSKFKLMASGASYGGFKGAPYLNREYSKEFFSRVTILKYKIGDTVYYQGHTFGRLDYSGLVAENPSAETAVVYPLFHMAEAVGWYKPEKGSSSYPDATRGLYLVGDTLFMGSNGIGVVAFDTVQKTWSRYDAKPLAISGAHLQLYYADADYMFISNGEFPSAGLHIYSMKRDKSVRLDAVPAKSIVELGHNMSDLPVQVPVDDRIFAKSAYMPIDWHLAMLDKVSPEGDNAYLFERTYFKNSRTAFKITKQQIEKAFGATKQKK